MENAAPCPLSRIGYAPARYSSSQKFEMRTINGLQKSWRKVIEIGLTWHQCGHFQDGPNSGQLSLSLSIQIYKLLKSIFISWDTLVRLAPPRCSSRKGKSRSRSHSRNVRRHRNQRRLFRNAELSAFLQLGIPGERIYIFSIVLGNRLPQYMYGKCRGYPLKLGRQERWEG